MNKHIFILLGLSFAVFFSILFNQFVGDDHVLFEANSFYTSWHHWPSLFKKEYLTPSTVERNPSTNVYHSGSVAYRPVLSLTYFFDYFLWKLNLLGYHLSNLILHIFNTLLVYIVLIKICRNPSMALFSALFFSLHPTKVEAVASIGYRADLLCSFWLLLSFLAFINYRTGKQQRKYWYGTLGFYFLALFTKESAIVLPAIYAAYDFYFQNLKENQIRKSILLNYVSLAVVTVFYLYIYCFVFPNTSFVAVKYLGGTLGNHVTAIFWIFTHYFVNLAAPFTVNMVPPLYLPPVEPLTLLKFLCGVSIFLILIVAIIKYFKKNRYISFFLAWFLISLIPVMNIIPLANPMAHRFLYFPLIGFAAALGLLLDQWQKQHIPYKNLDLVRILKITLIGLCVCYTLPLNIRWNNDVSVAKTLLEKYPDNIKSHFILAVQFLKAGKKKEAVHELEQCIRLGAKDPAIYYLMGQHSLWERIPQPDR